MNPTGSQLIADQPMRVLTRDLGDRLQAVTDALRHLDADLPLVEQQLRQGTRQRPLLVFRSGGERLREKLTQIAVMTLDGQRCLVGKFRGVDLCWPEAAH